jgi:hypothetical protein
MVTSSRWAHSDDLDGGDATTPEQGKALALELFDTPVDERERRHRRRLLAGARTPARRVRRATSRRPVRPVCSLPGALRCEHLTARPRR